mmetsp:Transcript_88178/g.175083  ORF Transcript_88178/g.175083 Transcript_88178/m.175083 type:complete len:225 (+) Transcript_88178:85-759(+)
MMASKQGPIVIALKKRLGPARRAEEEETVAELPADPLGDHGTATLGRTLSRSRSRRALRRSPSPLSHLAAPTIASSSVMNVAALEDIFARFHGQLDDWLHSESGKLERAETRGAAARESVQGCGDTICEFFRECSQRMPSELGPDPSVEGFASRTLPMFLETVDEDRRALQELTSALSSFADHHFPKNKELVDLKAAGSPVALLRAILRLLASPQSKNMTPQRG